MSAQTQTQPMSIPPAAQILQMANGYMLSQTIGVAARLGIADLLRDGPRTSDDLAQAVRVNADALYRTLRAMASVGIFTETSPRTFANTALSEVLRSDVPYSLMLRMASFEEAEPMECVLSCAGGPSSPASIRLWSGPPPLTRWK